MKQKTKPTKKRYIARPSQITKQVPTRRLRKRRAKNLRTSKKGFFPNPAPIKYVIVAQRASGKGPRMVFDGKNFSQRTPVTFDTVQKAATKARALIKQHSILHKYRVLIGHAPRPQ